MDEESFKLVLTKVLLENDPKCIASEVPFIEGSRRADLVMLSERNELYAFEIKSEKDNLDSLTSQLADYRKVFDYVYVVVATKHLSQARKYSAKNIGIIEIKTNKELVRKRKAAKRLRLDKRSLVASIDRSRLLYVLGVKASDLRNDRHFYDLASEKVSISYLRELFIEQLVSKYGKGFSIFKSEIGSVVHTEDLLHLGLERQLS